MSPAPPAAQAGHTGASVSGHAPHPVTRVAKSGVPPPVSKAGTAHAAHRSDAPAACRLHTRRLACRGCFCDVRAEPGGERWRRPEDRAVAFLSEANEARGAFCLKAPSALKSRPCSRRRGREAATRVQVRVFSPHAGGTGRSGHGAALVPPGEAGGSPGASSWDAGPPPICRLLLK